MNDSPTSPTPPTARRRPRAKNALIIGSVLLTVLVVLGFKSGWLAWRSDQRPVGKLRPADLVATTLAPDLIRDNPPSSGTSTTTLSPSANDDAPSESSVAGSEAADSSTAGTSVSSVTDSTPGPDHDHDADDD
jgi:hypothetical protein